jgi:hypothetical protein
VSGDDPRLQVAAIAFTAAVAGRLFVGAFAAQLFRRFDAAGAVAGMAVGTSVLTLLSVALSGIGFPTRDLPMLVVALLLVPLALAARRKRLDVLWPRGNLSDWATLLAPVLVSVWLGLLPITLGGGFALGNDTYTYSAFSEWLQGHAFSEPAHWEAQSPVTAIPALWQSQGYDLGIAHWLALWQATYRPVTVIVVYPAVSTFGLALLTAVTWLAARQVLRLGGTSAGATALAFAAVPHALYWGHHNGFLQQGYALPLVLFGLVLLTRCAAPAHWNAAAAALLALPFAFLLSVYLPLLPVLGFATAVALVPIGRRARRRRQVVRLAWFLTSAGLCVALYATRDLATALSPLHRFATSVAGGHIPWKAVDFAQFALGTRVMPPGGTSLEVQPWSALNQALTPLYGALVVSGFWFAARRQRSRPLAAAAAFVLVGAAYFAIAVNDPWSGRLGHTWNLFKLAQWLWPFALLLAALALRGFSPRPAMARAALLGLAFAVPVSQIAAHWPWASRLAETLDEMLPGTTLAALPVLRQRLQALPQGTLLVVGRPVNTHRWLGTAVSLLTWPRAVSADWADGASISNHPNGGEALHAHWLDRWDDPHVVPILAGFLPFQTDGVEELGGGFARLVKRRETVLVHVINPSGVSRDPAGSPTFALGQGRTKVVVFSPAARSAQLHLTLRPYRGRPGARLVVFLAGGDFTHRSVRLASETAPVAALPLAGETSLRVPLQLPRGLATIVLVVDEGRGQLGAQHHVTVATLGIAAREDVSTPQARGRDGG